jgi:hypothetical protein
MSQVATAMQAPFPQPSVDTGAEADLLISHLLDVMDALLDMVEEETRLVRAGKLDQVATLEQSKAELSRLYLADMQRIKANQPNIATLAPARLEDLRKRHDEFRAVLQINLTVLATAHAVSESIMRGVSEELARKAQPQAYGASGHVMAPPKGGTQPLTVSRVL